MPRYWKVSGTSTRPAALNRSYSREAIEDMSFRLPMIMISSTYTGMRTPFDSPSVPPKKRPGAVMEAWRPRSLTIKSKTSSKYSLFACLMPYKVLFSLACFDYAGPSANLHLEAAYIGSHAEGSQGKQSGCQVQQSQDYIWLQVRVQAESRLNR